MKTKKTKKVQVLKTYDSRVLAEKARREIEQSYNIDTSNGTKACYSDRYGWTLRRVVD